MSKLFYKAGRNVVQTLLSDDDYLDIVLVIDRDKFSCAGLFVKRGGDDVY